MLRSQWIYGSNFYINGKPVRCTFERYQDCEKIRVFSTKSEKKNLNFGFFDNFGRFGGNTLRIFSAFRVSSTDNNRYVLRKTFKNPPKILQVAIFFLFFFEQSFPDVIFVRFLRTWHRRIQLTFFFQTISFFSKNTIFLFDFFPKIGKKKFFGKKIFTPKFTVRKSR